MPQVQSSNISEIEYDEANERLEILFTTGGRYSYEGVSKEMYQAFLGASSKGSFFHQFVKGKYPWVRLS
jgi:KTSC domain